MVSPNRIRLESEMATMDSPENAVEQLGKVSYMTCPECGGSLWQVDEESNFLRFRCHVGHGYVAQDLLMDEVQQLDKVLGRALRVSEEIVKTARLLAEQARKEGSTDAIDRLDARINAAKEAAATLRALLLRGNSAHA